MPSILNVEEFAKDLKEVNSTKITKKTRFHPDGLFSEQIFGPLKNYTCQCGNYYGHSKSGGTCKFCGVDIVHSIERRLRFARVVLPIKVVSPIMYDLIISLGGKTIQEPLDILMKKEKSVLYKNSKDEYIVTDNPEDIKDVCQTWDKTEAIYELVNGISTKMVDAGIKKWEIIKDNINNLLIKDIIVLPPDLRPASYSGEKDASQTIDKINRFYVQLILKKEIMKNTTIDVNQNKQMFYTYFRQLQKTVKELYTYILEKLSKKEGLIRGNILGKRIDFSGRSVIIPEPLLKLNECSLPYLMILELFKIQISKKLGFKLLNEAIDYVDLCIENDDHSLLDVVEEVVKNEVCILNRQPSLHRLNMVGFQIKVNLDKVIKIHPLVCPGFNADFDGDQMAVYIPVSEVTKQEVRDKFMAEENLINPTNAELTTTPTQDIILGLYTLTSSEIFQKVLYKGKEISEGRKIFNECLPDDYPLIDEVINKKVLTVILNDIYFKYERKIIVSVLDSIKTLGFHYATIFATTMSLPSMYLPIAEELKNQAYSKETINEQVQFIASKDVENQLRNNFKYSYLIDSGARGKWDQARQLIFTRGFVSNFKGDILETPIKNNLIDGLTQKEFFNSTYGCRKGLLDTAVSTGQSGYLSRKLIFTCANLQLSETIKDCGTTDYLNTFVVNEKKARLLIDRYYLDETLNKIELITNINYKTLIGKSIKLRSPILCKSDDICSVCYGDLYKKFHSKYIGIIAAQSIGEASTQLVLRSFHLSGSAQMGKDQTDLKQTDIISSLSVASKLLHNKNKLKYKELVDALFALYIQNKEIKHVHFECVVSQLMWKGHKKWRLLENRNEIEEDYFSIQTVPEKESWVLGLGFSNPRKQLLKGILHSGNYKGIFDGILLGEKL